MTKFVGRKKELKGLRALRKKKSASLVVIRGRRRIGKSRLAEEFGKDFQNAIIFSGLPPTEGVTAETQRQEFARQMKKLRIPQFGSNDWGDLFTDLAEHCAKGRVLVVLDEVTWMGNKDPTFLGKLKTAWDLHFKKNEQLVLIISGSNSYWIEKNILSSTGFMGRVSYRLILDELPLEECDKFWGIEKNLVSPYEKFKLLAITGGVPRYLEEIDPKSSAEENVKRLCYRKEGLLFNEFKEIFSDIFTKQSEKYMAIVHCLADGASTLEEVAECLGRKKGGDLSVALEDLNEAGFIAREYSWHIKNGKRAKQSHYRLSDNYVRFYLKYIEPFQEKIEEGIMGSLPSGWLTMMGFHFENLVLKNKRKLFEMLSIPLDEVICAGPFFQTKTRTHDACQIDLLIQTKYNTLYLCEMKFEGGEVRSNVVEQVREKIKRLHIPKGFSIRPVFIHVNGVSDSVIESDFFANIIDFGEFLSSN